MGSAKPDAAPDLSGTCVLQVIPSMEAGGAERTTLEVARAVLAAGGKSVVVSSGGRLVEQLEEEGTRHVRLPMASKNPGIMWRSRGQLRRLIARENASLVHARSRAPAWPALWAARSAGVPFVTTWHGAYSGRTGLKLLYNSVMARGDVVIANSAFTAETIRETYLRWDFIEGRRIEVIPRGADIDAFSRHAVTRERRALAAERLGRDGLRVLLPGRLTAWKGQDVMVEAARRLREGRCVPVLRVALVGSAQGRGRFEEELRAMIASHGLTDSVTLHGPWDDMPAAYEWADVVVSASTRPEAFGRVAVEAMAMARPVVATDHGGARETVADGETGLLVPPGDARALARAIEALSDPAYRAQLGRAGEGRARRLFTTSAMTDATLSVYKDVLTKAAAGEGSER
jgi:glycosyltransferase involved in cell wall biosynthesis